MAIAHITLGAITLLSLPLQQATASSYVNTDTKMISADTSPKSFLSANPSQRQLEEVEPVFISNLKDYLGTAFESKLSKLPTFGASSKTPWPGGIWNNYLDGINYQWNSGEPNAAYKYATAFGMDAQAFMDAVSNDYGIGSQFGEKKCTSDPECVNNNGLVSSLRLCVARQGDTNRICVTEDFSISNGWAVASILENEPNCAVTYNGITFEVMDIKALLTLLYAYERSPSLIVGTRFRVESTDVDQYGRHSDPTNRDPNAGVFHITASLLLGRLNTSFVIDMDPGAKDISRPVIGFKVYEQKALSLDEAAMTYYGLDSYIWNDAAASIVYVKSSLTWIDATYVDGGLVASGRIKEFTNETLYTYLLEMSSDGDIIGGEWLNGSNTHHPDIMWLQTDKAPEDYVTSSGLKYADVKMLLEKATACSGGPAVMKT